MHRRGVWVLFIGLPWTIRGIVARKLSLLNAAKQQFWQVFASASDQWSTFHNDEDYCDSSGQPLKLWNLQRHALPFAWGYMDRPPGSSAPSRPSSVQLTADGIRFISAERGRVENLLNKEADKQRFQVKVKLFTSSTNETVELQNIAERQLPAGGLITEGENVVEPVAPVTEDAGLSARRCFPFEWEITEYPILLDSLTSSWGKAIFLSSIIVGLWSTVAAARVGWAAVGVGFGSLVFGYFSKQVMSAFQVSDGDQDVLAVMGEVGKRLMCDERLSMVGGGILVIDVKRCRGSVPSRSQRQEAAHAPSSSSSQPQESMSGEASMTDSNDTVQMQESGETVSQPITEGVWVTREVQVQWRKPLRRPHYPWFDVFCGPLLKRTMGWGIVYSVITFISGTVSPPIRYRQLQSGFILASVSLLAAMLSASGGNTRQPLLLKGSIGMIVGGVLTRVIVSVTRNYNLAFSHAYFEQIAGSLIAVGSWMLATAIYPPEQS